MNFKRVLYCLFSLIFSLNILSAEIFTVWDTFPMKDGSNIVIVDDAAKTVLKVTEGSSYQVGDLVQIRDLYNVSSNQIDIENSGEFTQAQRLGGLWKKQDGTPFHQITQITDWGASLIVVSDKWAARIYVDQEAFKKDFHLGDTVYIVNAISFDWPNYQAMFQYFELGDIWCSNQKECFINREEGISSQWFFPWDPY